MSESHTAVDGHVHFHPGFRWSTFLEAALRNLRGPQREPARAGQVSVCLLMADIKGQDTVGSLRRARPNGMPEEWTVRPTLEDESVRLVHDSGPELTFVSGRQIRTREGLEVLALATSYTFPDGQPFPDVLGRVVAGGAICVVPWGLGKWWGRRGRLVRDAVLEVRGQGPRIFLGDSGVRPRGCLPPSMLRSQTSEASPILCGSDPLPLPGQDRRPGSLGFILPGLLSEEQPADQIRRRVAALQASPPTFGRRADLGRVAWWNLRLRFGTGAQ